MEISLTWEVFPNLVIRTFELMGEFDEGVQYAVSKGFRLQRGINAAILDEEYGRSNFIFSQQEFEENRI